MVFRAGFAARAVGLLLVVGVAGCGGSDHAAQEVPDTSSTVAAAPASQAAVPAPTPSPTQSTADVTPSASATPPPIGCAQITEESIYIDVSSRESPSERDRRRESLGDPIKKLILAHCVGRLDAKLLSPCVVKAGAEEANAARLTALAACWGGRFPPKF